MMKHNAANERIKREYLGFLADAQDRDTATIDRVAASLARFEASTRAKHFNTFHREQAVAFKAQLSGMGRRHGMEGFREFSNPRACSSAVTLATTSMRSTCRMPRRPLSSTQQCLPHPRSEVIPQPAPSPSSDSCSETGVAYLVWLARRRRVQHGRRHEPFGGRFEAQRTAFLRDNPRVHGTAAA